MFKFISVPKTNSEIIVPGECLINEPEDVPPSKKAKLVSLNFPPFPNSSYFSKIEILHLYVRHFLCFKCFTKFIRYFKILFL